MSVKLKGTTIGEILGPAMDITDQADADDYFEQLVSHYTSVAKGPRTRQEAEKIVRDNLGYYAGYYSTETQSRVNRLFKTTHPVFGDTKPTAEEAFEAGKVRGEAIDREEKRNDDAGL